MVIKHKQVRPRLLEAHLLNFDKDDLEVNL